MVVRHAGEKTLADTEVVVFDLGETLLCEDRAWSAWARWLEVPPSLVMVALGAAIALGRDHREALALVRPGLDLQSASKAKEAAGQQWRIEAEDLYPDALSCLQRLRAARFGLGIAGNQPRAMERDVRRLRLPVDFVGASGSWGVAKPHPGFFARIVAEAGVPPERIAYVGDRVDNDVLPAKRAGMSAVFVRRGPWGMIQAGWPAAEEAHAQVSGLGELADLLAGSDRVRR